MDFDQIIAAGRARALDFGSDWPGTTSVLYRRIQIREQDLFSQASRVNPDYFGVNTVGVLDVNTDVNLKTLEDEASPIFPTSSITRVEIEDPGTHPDYQACDKVSIISPSGADAALAPRMILRNFVLHGYKGPTGDMQGVTSVCIYYGYRPANRALPMDGTELAELPPVYQELLVLDVTEYLLKMTQELAPERKSAALAQVQTEIASWSGTFMAEVTDYAGAQVSQFGAVVGAQRT